jgi:hypothetical protein
MGQDVADTISILNHFNIYYRLEQWNAAKHVLRYLKGSVDYALACSKSDKFVEGYIDAGFAGNIDNRRSVSGFVFKLANGPISKVSRRQNCYSF